MLKTKSSAEANGNGRLPGLHCYKCLKVMSPQGFRLIFKSFWLKQKPLNKARGKAVEKTLVLNRFREDFFVDFDADIWRP